MEKVLFTARKTIRNYTNGGNILIAATILAMIVVNIPFTAEIYNSLWNNEIALQIGKFNLFSHHGHPMTIMQFIKPNLIPVIIMLVIPPITIIGLIVLLVATLPAQSRAKVWI